MIEYAAEQVSGGTWLRFGPWRRPSIIMRLFGRRGRRRARYRNVGPYWLQSSWHFDGYEYEGRND